MPYLTIGDDETNAAAVAHVRRMIEALRNYADALEELDEYPHCRWYVAISLVIRRGESDAHTNGELMRFTDDMAVRLGMDRTPALSTAAYPDAMYIARNHDDAGTRSVILFPRVAGATINVDPSS